MNVFADTSGLYAYVDADNVANAAARSAWNELRRIGASVVTTNYVVTETLALCQRRFGLGATRGFALGMVPLLDIVWIGKEHHDRAVAALFAANRRDLSLVDCVSFETMRRLGIRRAFALDEHFREQGFEVVP